MAGEYLTMAEIEARYPNEWVLIDRPRKDRGDQTVGGWVAFHGPDRDEAYAKALELPAPRSVAVLFMGGPAGDEEFAL